MFGGLGWRGAASACTAARGSVAAPARLSEPPFDGSVDHTPNVPDVRKHLEAFVAHVGLQEGTLGTLDYTVLKEPA